MGERSSVSSVALYATSFVSTVVSAVSVSPHLFGSGGWREAFLAVAVSLAVTSLAAVPALCLAREGTGLLQAARLRLGKAAVLISAFYYAVLVYFGFYFLSFFLIFIENTIDPVLPVWAVAGCVTLAAVYGTWHGLSTVTRAGLYAFVLTVLGFGFIFLMLFKEISPANLYTAGPLQPDIPTAALFTAGRATSLVHLLVFMPRAKGRKITGFWILNTGYHLLCGAIVFFLAACLGNMAASQLFPVYTLAQLASFGALQRLDIIFLVLWIVGIVLRLCLDLLAGEELFSHGRRFSAGEQARFPLPKKLLLLQALLLAVPAAIAADHLPLQRWLFSSQMITIVSLLAGVVVPMFILCLDRICRSGKEAPHG